MGIKRKRLTFQKGYFAARCRTNADDNDYAVECAAGPPAGCGAPAPPAGCGAPAPAPSPRALDAAEGLLHLVESPVRNNEWTCHAIESPVRSTPKSTPSRRNKWICWDTETPNKVDVAMAMLKLASGPAAEVTTPLNSKIQAQACNKDFNNGSPAVDDLSGIAYLPNSSKENKSVLLEQSTAVERRGCSRQLVMSMEPTEDNNDNRTIDAPPVQVESNDGVTKHCCNCECEPHCPCLQKGARKRLGQGARKKVGLGKHCCSCWCQPRCACIPRVLPSKLKLSYELVFHCYSPNRFHILTGLSHKKFNVLYDFLGGDAVCEHLKYSYDRKTPLKSLNSTISVHTRLFMTLCRLRRGWYIQDIAFFFDCSDFIASTVCFTWIQLMYLQFKRIEADVFVSRANQPKKDRPSMFKPYVNFRLVMDVTEVWIQIPSNLDQQGNTFSDYKGGNVLLYLVACSCWGGISFISPGFEGNMTDREIYLRSGIRGFLQPGDVLLADRGFTVEEECDEDRVVLLHPPKLGQREKFTAEEEVLTKDIAKARIVVENVIRKMKCYNILNNITNVMLPVVDQITFVCASLVNFARPHLLPVQERNL